jgi:hypothetical protein
MKHIKKVKLEPEMEDKGKWNSEGGKKRKEKANRRISKCIFAWRSPFLKNR